MIRTSQPTPENRFFSTLRDSSHTPAILPMAHDRREQPLRRDWIDCVLIGACLFLMACMPFALDIADFVMGR